MTTHSTPGTPDYEPSTQPSESTQPTPSHDEPAPAESTPSTTSDDAPGRDLAVMPAGSLDERIRYANALAQAGDLIPAGLRDGRNANPGKVLLAVETGAMLGVHPVAAINGVNIIDGKATLAPALMSGLVRRAGHKLRITSTGTVEGGDIAVTATLIRSDDPEYPFTATWTPHRAARAGLCTYAEKGGRWVVTARSNSGRALPWEAYTEALLKARAIGEACREGAEDVLMGIHYTPEELGATVDADGVYVESTVVSVSSNAPAEPTPQEVAEQAVARAKAMPDVPSLVGVWNALPAIVARNSWASGYADLMDYAKRTVVAHPYGAVDRPTLLDAFGIIRTHLEGGGSAEATDTPAPTPAPAGAPDDVVDAVVETADDEIDAQREAARQARKAEEIHDAEVVAAPDEAGGDVRGTDQDPWATPTVPGHYDGSHDGAVIGAATDLNAEIVSDEQASAAEVRRLEHEAAQEEARREAAETAGKPAEPTGAGRAALAAARAEVEAANERRRAQEAAGVTRGKGKA